MVLNPQRIRGLTELSPRVVPRPPSEADRHGCSGWQRDIPYVVSTILLTTDAPVPPDGAWEATLGGVI